MSMDGTLLDGSNSLGSCYSSKEAVRGREKERWKVRERKIERERRSTPVNQ